MRENHDWERIGLAMKVAAVATLPFHEWVMAPTIDALEQRGHTVALCVHQPEHKHHWISEDSPAVIEAIQQEPDFILCADYPCDIYGDIPVVGLRHSLASRGNTWDVAWEHADFLVTWSEWDRAEFYRRGVFPRRGFIQTGCTWAEWVNRPIPQSDWITRPVILWAPTWNEDLNRRDEVLAILIEQAEAQKAHVIVRVHPATEWREPEFMATLRRQKGFSIDDTLTGPWYALQKASVLVTDLSGIGLLALAVGDADLPVIQVEKQGWHTASHAQIDQQGPEWVFRNDLGCRVFSGQQLSDYLDRIAWQKKDEFQRQRQAVRDQLLGQIEGSCDRLVTKLEELFYG
jgi:hypothetical protein